jgi:hypothetical protein
MAQDDRFDLARLERLEWRLGESAFIFGKIFAMTRSR